MSVISYKPGMVDVVRKLILERLEELDLNMSEVSKRLGRSHSYLQQFLKRGVPTELREKERALLAEILKVSEDELRGPSNPLPKRGYEKKVEHVKNLIEVAKDRAHTPPLNERGAAQIVSGKELFGTGSDLPIYGTAPGVRDGALVVSETVVDWMVRPATLSRVQDGYGIIVGDDSMSPEHKLGSIALINPHLPPRAGDTCAFRDKPAGGHVIIREYRGQTETHWKVHQHNPPRDLTLKKNEWRFVHRTVGNLSA